MSWEDEQEARSERIQNYMDMGFVAAFADNIQIGDIVAWEFGVTQRSDLFVVDQLRRSTSYNDHDFFSEEEIRETKNTMVNMIVYKQDRDIPVDECMNALHTVYIYRQ